MADAIFNDDELAADAVTGDVDNAPTETQAEQRLRDEQGRFAPKADEPAPGHAAAPDEQLDDDGRARQVPQGALHAEREKRKAAETKWQDAQKQLDAIAAMRAHVQARQPEPPPPPDGDDNSVEYLKQRIAQIEGAQNEFQTMQNTAALDDAETAQIYDVMSRAEGEFRATKPDYDAAIEHIVNARAQELQLYGLGAAEIQETIRAEVRDIAKSAISQGRNPAEVGYQLATFRGYRPEAPQQAQGSATTTIAAIGAAKAGSRSLGQAAGSAPSAPINAATIAAMSTDEFDVLYSTPEGRRVIDAL